MGNRWFKHGKWPKWMVRLHAYTILSFVLLMVTGVALFLPTVHTILIPYLKFIYYGHVVLGVTFGIALLVPLFARLPMGKLIRRLDWLFPLVFGVIIVITGIFIWQVTLFPTAWRSAAFHWHTWMSYLLCAWVLVHATYKTIGYRPTKDGVNAQLDPNRRRFLRWVGAGMVGGAVLSIVDPFGMLKRALTSRNGQSRDDGSAADFAAYYTVTGGYPSIDLTTYRLHIDGLVFQPLNLQWSDVLALAPLQEQVDFHCVTGWSVPNVTWKGVHLKSIVERAGLSSKAKYVHFYSSDGAYTESLSLTQALDSTVMLAHQLNGQPLSAKQGFPLRLVVPNMYGYKSIKWVNRVEFSDRPLIGYWEARGYANDAYLGRGL